MMTKIRRFVFRCVIVVSVFMAAGCNDKPTPRPYGYFRIDLPPHIYRPILLHGYPYAFDMPVSAKLELKYEKGEKFWFDLHYPSLNANVYCSYKSIHSNLFDLVEDTRKMVYKHMVKADEIAEIPYENRDKKVYGILYEITGNAASPLQFILTDSIRHFLRGALYFESVPNKDSIAPIASYVQQDIVHLIESFKWK